MKKVYEKYKWKKVRNKEESENMHKLITSKWGWNYYVFNAHNIDLDKAIKETEEKTYEQAMEDLSKELKEDYRKGKGSGLYKAIEPHLEELRDAVYEETAKEIFEDLEKMMGYDEELGFARSLYDVEYEELKKKYLDEA